MIALFNLVATTAAKKSSANPLSLIFVVVLVGAVYFLFLRPQQQRARRQREQTSTIDVGDEILTAGGIIGIVIETQPDRLVIESGGDATGSYDATGSRMVVLRSAVSRKLTAANAPVEDYDDDDDEEDEDAADDEHEDHDHEDHDHDHEVDGSSDSPAEGGSGA
jgi:preprotein translocase subunit YajC